MLRRLSPKQQRLEVALLGMLQMTARKLSYTVRAKHACLPTVPMGLDI